LKKDWNMSVAKAVIGSAYGDEGKGLMVDFLAASGGVPVVARTNGGSQAGHTVQTPDGRRHVFHHLASGALAGVPTHLTQFFVSHPMFFTREVETLKDMGANVSVSVDPRSAVTTPFDVAINQAVELARGGARHGSCGVGFGETLERGLEDRLRLAVGDFEKGEAHIRKVLDVIRFDWAPERLSRLGVEAPAYFPDFLRNDRVVERFIDDCLAFWNAIVLRGDAQLPEGVLFEGAQGLQLDQDYGAFPHVTRSNTGLKNMAAVAEEAGIDTIDVAYMTRAYATRHGAGPFVHEDADKSWLSMVDPTNEPNPWQGTIRSAPVDLDGIAAAVAHDLRHADGRVEVSATLGVSCVDQVAGRFKIGLAGRIEEIDRRSVAEVFGSAVGLAVDALSYGPTRSDVASLGPIVRRATP
jgi:adenylosuccinate synthase